MALLLSKLGATFMALLLVITIVSSSQVVQASRKELDLTAKMIIDEGKIVLLEPEIEVVKSSLQCIALNGYCNDLIANDCCFPYVCKKIPFLGGLCVKP